MLAVSHVLSSDARAIPVIKRVLMRILCHQDCLNDLYMYNKISMNPVPDLGNIAIEIVCFVMRQSSTINQLIVC